MSGLEKYAGFALIGVAEAAVEAARAIQAAQEEAARRKAQEQEAQRRFFEYQQGLEQVSIEARQRFEQVRSGLSPADDARLGDELARLSATMLNSTDRSTVVQAELEMGSLLRHLDDALLQQQQQQARQELADERARVQQELGELDAQLNALREAGSVDWDAEGRASALRLLNQSRGALQSDDPARWQVTLAEARRQVEQHRGQIRVRQAEAESNRQQQRARLDEAASLSAGLQADPAVQLWARVQAQELAARVTGWQAALAAGDAQAAGSADLEQFKADSTALLARVNAAQVKAQQRDYVLQSIREVLQEMGFFPGAVEAETPGHPASAMRFRALNAAGQSLGVSVPVQGEIYYDLEGFPMSTEAKVGGGTAAVCDSAEAVIQEMHDAIESQFGVQAGELLWEGKDPLRNLRMADQLPRSGDSENRGGSR